MRRIGTYDVIDTLGRGGMGVVYEARSIEDGEHVALKILTKGDLSTLQRFAREARILQFLGQHRNIVGLREVGEEEGRPFLVMDLIKGGTLLSLLEARKQQEQHRVDRRSVEILSKVGHALQFAHEAGIIHRDLKPSNILIDGSSGEPVLTDFGVAKNLQAEEITRTGIVVGTLGYMAPEQLAATDEFPVDRRTDVYSLGVILYRVLTGRKPFEGEDIIVMKRICVEAPQPPSELVPHVPPSLERICLKALKKRPGERYSTAQSFAADLDRWLADESVLASMPDSPALRRGGRTSRRVQLTAFVLAVAVLVLGTIAWSREDARRAVAERLWTQSVALLADGRPVAPETLAALTDLAFARDDDLGRAFRAEVAVLSGDLEAARLALDDVRSAGVGRSLLEAELAAAEGDLQAAAAALAAAGSDGLPWWPDEEAPRWARLGQLAEAQGHDQAAARAYVLAADRLAGDPEAIRRAAGLLDRAHRLAPATVRSERGRVAPIRLEAALPALTGVAGLERSDDVSDLVRSYMTLARRIARSDGAEAAAIVVERACELDLETVSADGRDAARILADAVHAELEPLVDRDAGVVRVLERSRRRLLLARLAAPEADLTEASGELRRLGRSDRAAVRSAARPWLVGWANGDEAVDPLLERPISARRLEGVDSSDRETWPPKWRKAIERAGQARVTYAALGEWLVHRPELSVLWLHLADAAWRQGRFGEAVRAARVAARLEQSPETYFWVGQYLHELGDAEHAVRYARRAVAIGRELGRENRWHPYLLARVLVDVGGRDGAAEAEELLAGLAQSDFNEERTFWHTRADAAELLGDQNRAEAYRRLARQAKRD